MNQTTSSTCFQCGAPLILVSKETQKIEGSLFPQTTSIYRCSNTDCQERKDVETEKRIKMQADKEIATTKRLEEKLSIKKTTLLNKLQNQN